LASHSPGFSQINPALASERPKDQPQTGGTQDAIVTELLGGSFLLDSSIIVLVALGAKTPYTFLLNIDYIGL